MPSLCSLFQSFATAPVGLVTTSERTVLSTHDGSANELQHQQIEQMKKQMKKHRDALDFSRAWAEAERQAEQARQARVAR